MNTPEENESPEERVSASEAIGDFVGDVASTLAGIQVPAPIRKNVFKAVGRLCSAAVDIPVAKLEGKAAEIRAETAARLRLINTTSQKIEGQIEVDPEYAQIAARKHAQRIVREQANLDNVVKITAAELRGAPPLALPDGQDEVAPLDDEWLNNFEREASQKTSLEMQTLFGRILAGEILRPSSYSIKTVKLLAHLDSGVAGLFRALCSGSITLRHDDSILDARMVSPGGNASRNDLREYGLGFDGLNLLHEYGLIIADYNSYFNYSVAVVKDQATAVLPFGYQHRLWVLIPKSIYNAGELLLHGVGLSKTGRELLGIVDTVPLPTYTSRLQEYFSSKNLSMTNVTRGAGNTVVFAP